MAQRQTARYLIERFRTAGIRPDTRHGQNFLVDLNLVELLAASAELTRQDLVLEVGTGTGALTAMLARAAGAVVTVELSAELYQLAREELIDFDNIVMLHQDALRNKNNLDDRLWQAIAAARAEDPRRRLKLVANLPYNIATPVLSNLLMAEQPPCSMTVTIQKELADRILARPSTKDYSALSVWVQSQCEVELVRILPPTVFWPRPKVHSAIIHIVLDPHKRAQLADRVFFHSLVRGLFLHRRKYLRSGLLSALARRLEKPQADQILAQLGFGPDTRAEQLDVAQLRVLSEAVRPLAGHD